MNRWTEESDIETLDMAEIAAQVINGWLDEPVVSFEADSDFFEEDEEDEPELPG